MLSYRARKSVFPAAVFLFSDNVFTSAPPMSESFGCSLSSDDMPETAAPSRYSSPQKSLRGVLFIGVSKA